MPAAPKVRRSGVAREKDGARVLRVFLKLMISLLSHLTPEQHEIQQAARDFARAEIAPYTAQWDRDAYFEPALVQKLGELGFLGMLVPETFDGLGLDTLTYLVALEEIAAVDASVAVTVSVHN